MQSKPMNSLSKKILSRRQGENRQHFAERMHAQHEKQLQRQDEVREARATVDEETGKPLFQPAINPLSRAMVGSTNDRHRTGAAVDVGESLYRNAVNRKVRHE